MTTIDLNKVSFFKPVKGKTLREQLHGKKLAGAEVVEYLRSLEEAKDFVPPAHWEKPSGGSWVYGFSLTHLRPRYWDRPKSRQEPLINGFVWAEDGGFDHHFRHFDGDPLDLVVGDGWCAQDWILIESE